MLEQYDVVIIGAGPSGSTCALALGNSGLKVALIDKHEFPRDKTCGDAVAAYVPKVLNTINPDLSKKLQCFPYKEMVNTCRIVAPNGKPIDIKFREQGFISPRIHFDQFLLEQASQLANVKVYTNTQVLDIQSHATHMQVLCNHQLQLEAKLVVGCDGAQGVSAKKLTTTKKDLKHYSGAVRAYYENVTAIPDQTFELHFLKDLLPGYLWIFPLPNGQANVGLGMLSDAVSKRKINLREELDKALRENEYLAERFKHARAISPVQGYGLPLGSRKVCMSGERFMLCGDAASLIDPVSGEGIGQAIISGRYAGWQALKCFEKNDFSAQHMLQYNDWVYHKIWSDNQKRYWVQRLINGRPWLVNGLVNLATSNAWLRKKLERIVW